MGLKVTNNAFGTLNAGINSTDTVIVLEAGQGARFPVLSAGDDIVRAKTIAKVTSTHVTCTYADGSFCVPCVLMAC